MGFLAEIATSEAADALFSLDWNVLQKMVIAFMSSKAFIVSAICFFAFLLFRRIVLFLFNSVKAVCVAVATCLNPFRLRSIVVHFISLIFMIVGFATIGETKSRLNGDTDHLLAILGGAIAMTIWATGLFIFNGIKAAYHTDAKEKVSDSDKFFAGDK